MEQRRSGDGQMDFRFEGDEKAGFAQGMAGFRALCVRVG